MRLWGGRFGPDNDEAVAAFGRSIDVDAELALDDLDGSVAHVRGLGRAGILSPDEVATLLAGLAALRHDVENGELAYPVSEVTIAGNLKDMFKRITAADDLVFKYGTNAPTLRIDGMTLAGA